MRTWLRTAAAAAAAAAAASAASSAASPPAAAASPLAQFPQGTKYFVNDICEFPDTCCCSTIQQGLPLQWLFPCLEAAAAAALEKEETEEAGLVLAPSQRWIKARFSGPE